MYASWCHLLCVCVCVWHYLLELKAWNSTGSIRCGLRYNKSTTNRDSGVWALVCKSQLAQAIPREALRHAYNRAHRAVHRAGRWVWSTGDGRQSTALGHVHRPVAKGCQQQTNDCHLFVALGSRERAVEKLFSVGQKFQRKIVPLFLEIS